MKKTGILLLAIATFSLSCKDKQEEPATEEVTMEEVTENEWITLFAGDSMENWKAYNQDTITQWTIEDNTLAFKAKEGKREGTENLITKDQFTSFELSLEWKISEGGNSGVMWVVQEEERFDEPYRTGPEIQVLDNKRHPDAQNGPKRQAGALYDMVPPSQDVTKPAGEWNEMIIKIDHTTNQGTVTMNGTQITEFPVHGEQWNQLVENSKFADWEYFGAFAKGHIALQDHDDPVWYRNIKIKRLE